jgi:hypothetical protein
MPSESHTTEEIIAEARVDHMRNAKKEFAIQAGIQGFSACADRIRREKAHEIVGRQLGALQTAAFGETCSRSSPSWRSSRSWASGPSRSRARC